MDDHEAARLRAAVEQIEAGLAELRCLLDPASAGEPAPEYVAPGIRAVVEAVRDLGGGPVTLKAIAHRVYRQPGSIRYAVDAAVSRGLAARATAQGERSADRARLRGAGAAGTGGAQVTRRAGGRARRAWGDPIRAR
jgi:hypothetical protein